MPATVEIDPAETCPKAEVCRRLNISPGTLRTWIETGLVRERRLPGARPRVFVADVQKLLDQSK